MEAGAEGGGTAAAQMTVSGRGPRRRGEEHAREAQSWPGEWTRGLGKEDNPRRLPEDVQSECGRRWRAEVRQDGKCWARTVCVWGGLWGDRPLSSSHVSCRCRRYTEEVSESRGVFMGFGSRREKRRAPQVMEQDPRIERGLSLVLC